MIALFIIGILCLGLSYPLMKILDKRGSRWSNLVMAILIIVGIVCIGFFAGLE